MAERINSAVWMFKCQSGPMKFLLSVYLALVRKWETTGGKISAARQASNHDWSVQSTTGVSLISQKLAIQGRNLDES